MPYGDDWMRPGAMTGYGTSTPQWPQQSGQTPAALPQTQNAPVPGAAQAGMINPPNPFEDKQAAIVRAASMAGINLGSFTPAAKAVAKRASDLINELALNMPNNPGMLESSASMLEGLAGLIRRGVGGEKIFGGNMAGAQQLESLASGFNANPADANNIIGAWAASLLGTPGNAQSIFSQARYGGMPEQTRSAAERNLIAILDRYNQQLETGGYAEQNTPNTFLQRLLGLPAAPGSDQPLTVGAGAALPGSASVLAQAMQGQPGSAANPQTVPQLQLNPYGGYGYGGR